MSCSLGVPCGDESSYATVEATATVRWGFTFDFALRLSFFDASSHPTEKQSRSNSEERANFTNVVVHSCVVDDCRDAISNVTAQFSLRTDPNKTSQNATTDRQQPHPAHHCFRRDFTLL